MPPVADLVGVVATAGWGKALFLALVVLAAIWLWKRPSVIQANARMIEANARATEAAGNAVLTQARGRWLDRRGSVDRNAT